MNHTLAIFILFVSPHFCNAAANITENSPLIPRKTPHLKQQKNTVVIEVCTAAARMQDENKSLQELRESFLSEEAFAVAKAYIYSPCPREALLRLCAEYSLSHDAKSNHIQAINEFLESADRCDRCK